MAAQKGRDLLLKVDSTGLGVFQTVAGLRASTLSFNAQTVDSTSQESIGAWRELLAGAGLKSASLRGQGIFKDALSDATVRGYFFNATIVDWQAIIPDFGTVQGKFQISSLEFAGRHDGEVTFEMSLESSWSPHVHGDLIMVNRHRGEIEAELNGAKVHSGSHIGRIWLNSNMPMVVKMCWRWPNVSSKAASRPLTPSR